MRAILLASVAALPLLVSAQQTMFRCKAADGSLSFQQHPCADGTKGERVEAKPVPTTEMGANILERSQRISDRRSSGAMSEEDMRRELGNPTVTNTDVFNGVVRQQHVYRYPDGSVRYVYTRNGEVEGAQVRPAVNPRATEPCYSRLDIENAIQDTKPFSLTPQERQARLARVQEMQSCRR